VIVDVHHPDGKLARIEASGSRLFNGLLPKYSGVRWGSRLYITQNDLSCRPADGTKIGMARPTRIDFPGAWYLVLNRGIEKQLIFR